MAWYYGLATGIGSMPYLDPRIALETIFSRVPALPHWPQLPQRGVEEGLIHQSFRILVDTALLAVRGGRAVFADDAPEWPERLTAFYDAYLAAEAGDEGALHRFGLPEQAAVGFHRFLETAAPRLGSARGVKGQVVGPLTMGFQLRGAGGGFAFYDDQLRDLVIKTLAMNARWQCRELSRWGLPVLFFVDDPAIAVYGSHGHITLTREMIVESLAPLFSAILGTGAACGLHACDAADWSIPLDCDLDVLSFDADRFGDTIRLYAERLGRFLDRGGAVAWGIVPTRAEAAAETAEGLSAKLRALWSDLSARGVDRDRLWTQALITPACGTGLLPTDLAEAIYRLTAEVATRLLAPAE